MSRYGSADVGFVLISGQDVVGDLTDLEDTQEAVVEDTTVLGEAWEEMAFVGVSRYTLTQEGFYNDGVNRINAALVTPGSSKVFSFAPEGNTLGKAFIGFPAVQVDYTRSIARAELHKAKAEYRASGQKADKGVILHVLKAETAASGNTEGADSQDAGASSANGGAGYLQVTAVTLGGYDDVTVKVRHSADDTVYADLVTFTDVTGSGGQRIAVAGTVNQHLAHSWAFNGSGTGQSITYFVGFARG